MNPIVSGHKCLPPNKSLLPSIHKKQIILDQSEHMVSKTLVVILRRFSIA